MRTYHPRWYSFIGQPFDANKIVLFSSYQTSRLSVSYIDVERISVYQYEGIRISLEIRISPPD